MILLLLFLIATMVALLLPTSQDTTATVEIVHSSGEGQDVIKVNIYRGTRQPSTWTTTEATSPEPDVYTETPTTEIPSRQPAPAHSDPILCTTGDRAVFTNMYPADGVCDYLFYTHVYSNPSDRKVYGIYNQGSLKAFYARANSSQKTGYGISIDMWYTEEAKVLLASSNGTRIMNTLWNAKVHHHGVLGEVWNTTTNGRLTRLGVIRELKKHQDRLYPASTAGYQAKELVVGLRLYRIHGSDVVRDALLELSSLPVTTIVQVTHVQIHGKDEVTSGATLWKTQRINVFQQQLMPTAEGAAAANIQGDIRVMVSFTMAVSGFRMKDDWNNTHDIKKYPLRYIPMDYSEVCLSRMKDTPIMAEPEYYMVAGNLKMHYLIIYETVATLRAKINFTLLINPHGKHGVAMFDLEYDDYNNECGQGAHHRITKVKEFLAH